MFRSRISSYAAQSTVLLITVLVGLMLIISPPYAAAAAMASPVMALLQHARRLKDLLDYRVLYLCALTYWGLSPTIGLLSALNGNDAPLRAVSTSVYYNYAIGLSLSPLLIYFFRPISISSYFRVICRPTTFAGSITILNIAYFMTLAILMTLRTNTDVGPIRIILPSLVCYLVLFQGALIAQQDGKFGSLAWIGILLLITTLATSSGVANRTSLLMPLLSGLLCLLMASRYKNKAILSLYTAASIAILLFIMGIANIQKQLGQNYLLLIPELAKSPDLIFYSITNTNYAAKPEATILYFDLLQKTIGNDLYRPGHYAIQLFTSFAPRALWTSKPQYDISSSYFSEGVIDRPLYFDFLFDRLIDSGAIGVFLYHLLYLSMMRFCLSLGNVLALNGMKATGISLYALSLVIIFMAIRGPIILIAWFLFPAILLAISLLTAKLFFSRRIILRSRLGPPEKTSFTAVASPFSRI